jgi:hypothetical protein
VRCRNAIAVLVGLLALAAGCRAGRWLAGGDEEPLRFDHRAHAARGIECTACHDAASDRPRAGHPACAPCHAIGEEPDQGCALCHAAGTYAAPAAAPENDLRFSHRLHLARAVPCAECHPGVASATRLGAARRPSMERCLQCHRGLGPRATECAVCHERTRATTRPPSHDARWTEQHGDTSRAEPELCATCHAEADCVRCHQEIAPRDHTEFWIRRGHGLESEWDRERCMACHRQDECVQCHRTTPPANHVGGWGEPTFLHCQRCHYPVEETSCAVCHERAHPQAVPFGGR